MKQNHGFKSQEVLLTLLCQFLFIRIQTQPGHMLRDILKRMNYQTVMRKQMPSVLR